MGNKKAPEPPKTRCDDLGTAGEVIAERSSAASRAVKLAMSKYYTAQSLLIQQRSSEQKSAPAADTRDNDLDRKALEAQRRENTRLRTRFQA